MKKIDVESHNQPAIKRRKLKDNKIYLLISKLDGKKRNDKDFEKLLKGEKIYTVHTQGTGRKTKYIDCEEYYTSELNKIGVKFEILNDAPRGGKLGNFIKVDLDSSKTSYDYFNLKDGYLTDKKIDLICKFYEISNYTKNSDKTIDVDGDVYLQGKNLKKLPLKFNIVTGNFICCNNKLTTLEGSPVKIMGDANFSENNLTSLKGCPKYIGGHITLNQNQLTSLEYCPDYIGNNFNCSDNKITSVEFFPKYLFGKFNCRRPNDIEHVFQEETILDLMIELDSIKILNKLQITELDYNRLERQFTIHKILN